MSEANKSFHPEKPSYSIFHASSSYPWNKEEKGDMRRTEVYNMKALLCREKEREKERARETNAGEESEF